MFITIFDRIEQWILDYFDCPVDPDPNRVKIFWKYILGLCLFSCILAVSFYIYVNADEAKMLIVGSALMLLGLIMGNLCKPSKETKYRIQSWWHGEGEWYGIMGISKKVKNNED